MRLNADGTRDTTFNAGGVGANSVVDAVAVQPDGKIVIGGGFTTYNGDAAASDRVMQLNADGTRETTFNAGGAGANGEVGAVAVQPDGKIVIGGLFTSYNGDAATSDKVMRLNADGTRDTTFNAGGAGADNLVIAVAVQLDGKIVIGGVFTSYNGDAAAPDRVMRLDGDLFVNWPAGDATDKIIQLPIINDGITEGDETLTLMLAVMSGDATLGSPSSSTLTIHDPPNTPPTIMAAGPLTRQQGSAAINSEIATVNDTESSAGGVTVAVTSANPSNGVTVSNITNTSGIVTADVIAACGASDAGFTLTATDGNGATATATLNVTVTANTAPTLSYSTPQSVAFNGSLDVSPTTATDNGSITGYSVFSVSPALTTAPTVNSSGVVAITNAQPVGSHVITIRATDNCGATTDVSFTLNVSKGSQTITFSALADKTFGDADFNVSATSDSGLAVSLAASANCTVTSPSPGTVHITGAGSCTITASQAGDSNYNAAPDVQQSFNIAKANQTITFNALSDKTFGDADFSVSATASSGLSVSFAASGQCTVTGTSVHLTGAGSCTITAKQAGDANFNAAADVPQSFNIANTAKAATTTAVSSSLNPSRLGESVTFTATVTSSSGTPTGSVEFFDGATSMGTSSLSGGSAMLMSSALTAGSRSITAVYAGAANFLGSSSPALLQTVKAPTPTGSNVTVQSSVGSTTITITFPSIIIGGTTTVTPTDPSSVGTLPGGYNLFGGSLAFEISTTAIFSGPITVCFQVPPITDATQFANLRILHSVGKQDLVVANSGSNNASIRLGDGAGSFGAVTNFGAGTSPISVTVGDFNNDDKPDLAVANQSSNNVSVRLGDGTGSFGAITNFAVGTSPSSVVVGDFNNDSKPDLAVANATTNNVSVLLGNGSGGFGATTNYSMGTSPRSVAVGDFNLDGKPDLAVANASSNNVSVRLGDGTGNFGSATTFTVGTSPRSVAVGDFNLDGKPDLVVANATSNNVSVRLGNGVGGFGAATNFVVGTPVSVAVGDFNNDAKPDLAVVNQGSNNVSVRLGDGTGSFGATTNFAVGTSPRSVAVADFNNDGKLDLTVANATSNNVSVRLGDGAGSFGTATNFAMGTSPVSVAVGNFNKDTVVIDQTILSGPNAPDFATKTICASVTSFSPFLLANHTAPTSADLDINKSDGSGNVLLGDNVTYTIDVENLGPDDATGLTVTDTLPASVTFVSAPDCTFDSPTYTVTCIIGNLSPNTGVTRTIIGQATVAGEITNTATVTASSTDPNLANNTDDSETDVVSLSSLSFSPATVTGGCQNSTGTVTLTNKAPLGGVTINLSSNSATASVPATVLIAGDTESTSFTVTTQNVSSSQTPTITATLNTALGPKTVSKTLSVVPVGVGSLTLSPSAVKGGNNVTGTVNLVCQAPADTVVTLSSSNTSVAKPTESSITILQGQTSKTFTVKTFAVSSTKTVNIKATANGISKEATLTVKP
jgi:uncharacterized repeat protein (TIGR01451 family)/uncharacterized delta-60 repeat protein